MSPSPASALDGADRFRSAWWALGLWATATAVLTFTVGGAIFVWLFCGSDWDAPCQQNNTAGWVVITVTITLTVAVAAFTLRRSVVLAALASVPLQLWFYIAYAIPTAASVPN
ncbi:hypothetical protein [Candidatus Poriferisodalis sp.]|uniref:hypothetical protein n=1 Tax=Candidatus Poriferisodalis sp. TaxID=3101277 RepID=UPI003B02A1A8